METSGRILEDDRLEIKIKDFVTQPSDTSTGGTERIKEVLAKMNWAIEGTARQKEVAGLLERTFPTLSSGIFSICQSIMYHGYTIPIPQTAVWLIDSPKKMSISILPFERKVGVLIKPKSLPEEIKDHLMLALEFKAAPQLEKYMHVFFNTFGLSRNPFNRVRKKYLGLGPFRGLGALTISFPFLGQVPEKVKLTKAELDRVFDQFLIMATPTPYINGNAISGDCKPDSALLGVFDSQLYLLKEFKFTEP